VHGDEFEALQREREWFHTLTVPPGAWAVIRVDGRSFSRFTERRFDKPFDPEFSRLMTHTAEALVTEFDARYGYTESDEISILLDPSFDLFGRGLEKLVSISAGLASARFTAELGEPVTFDSRVWIGASIADVVDYFSWRQTDALRCALNGWCYWTLRQAGRSARQATRELNRTNKADKNELLSRHGITFDDVPGWQRRGIGLWWETYDHEGFDPVREITVATTRRRIRTETELPARDDYRALIGSLIS
jgi:tRNA(His) guanylyltransferase